MKKTWFPWEDDDIKPDSRKANEEDTPIEGKVFCGFPAFFEREGNSSGGRLETYEDEHARILGEFTDLL